jgi:hypothetical protein
MNKFFPLFLIVFFYQCTVPQSTEAPKSSPPEKSITDGLPKELIKAFDAHGSVEKWKTYKSLRYTRTAGENSEIQLIDLENRKVLIMSDTYTLGFNGKDVWVAPDSTSFPGRSARFFHNLWFYFFSFPHILSDPGVMATTMQPIRFNGVLYDRVLITYGEEIGDSPEDKYILFINQETSQLDLINYSVTYYDTSRADQFNALVYEGWTTINDIRVPTQLKGYRWENDTLGDLRYHIRFSDIQFGEEKPEQSVFEIPDGAYVEKRVD